MGHQAARRPARRRPAPGELVDAPAAPPGAEPARLVIPADELFRLEREQGIAFTDMIPYVTLADGTELTADPLERDADTAA
jgi:hypothetical protein